ncbi:hypothetical protein [Streptomyces anulatus]|uniref:hypothetical protein n=1 Tax=Streptomyces anulatus TaxID=1892 RepID=UPI0038654686|nr:hypothetical protein OG238_40370 [Streptomyces anulatus]
MGGLDPEECDHTSPDGRAIDGTGGAQKVKDTDGRERPMWRTRWTAPDTWTGDQAHPLVLLVFNKLGERNPDITVSKLSELTPCGGDGGTRATTTTTGRIRSSRRAWGT